MNNRSFSYDRDFPSDVFIFISTPLVVVNFNSIPLEDYRNIW